MAIQQYLARYAENEAREISGIDSFYDHVLCIPAFLEASDFLDKNLEIIADQSVLIILIVNSPEDAGPNQLLQNQQLLKDLENRYPLKKRVGSNMSLHAGPYGKDLLLIERCLPGNLLKKKDGVGQARKIICDIACRLFEMNKIKSPWIHTTDADVLLPTGYFNAPKTLDVKNTSAGLYPFQHLTVGDNRINLAQKLYDLSLHYYVEGLKWSDSAWAFHTVGSTMVINALHYTQVRGFPGREAGEDFYLLNKLGKIGKIEPLKSNPLLLECRISERVPFGTGPAIKKILALDNPAKEFLFYHPHCFVYLKCWLALAKLLWTNNQKVLTKEFIKQWVDKSEFPETDCTILLACLESLGLQKCLDHAFTHSTSEKVFNRHLHNWFDAFQTLKFIHWLRNEHYPSQPLAVIQKEQGLPFVAACSDYDPVLPA